MNDSCNQLLEEQEGVRTTSTALVMVLTVVLLIFAFLGGALVESKAGFFPNKDVVQLQQQVAELTKKVDALNARLGQPPTPILPAASAPEKTAPSQTSTQTATPPQSAAQTFVAKLKEIPLFASIDPKKVEVKTVKDKKGKALFKVAFVTIAAKDIPTGAGPWKFYQHLMGNFPDACRRGVKESEAFNGMFQALNPKATAQVPQKGWGYVRGDVSWKIPLTSKPAIVEGLKASAK